jgi:3-mercaptopyruvate sulfurtransferase SseA
MIKHVTTFAVATITLLASEVNITEELSYITTMHDGSEINISRVQDKRHKLTNNFSKTSRECPPFCIQPMKIKNITTVGELEVLNFIQQSNSDQRKLLIDARSTEWYEKGTIPSAVNLPFLMLKKEYSYIEKILPILGAKKIKDTWYFNHAYTLLIFGNGAWDSQANRAINYLIGINYPEEKLLYYRGGIQSWQSLGLTIK